MKWNPIKTCPPPKDEEILVSDGVYVHEASSYVIDGRRYWSSPEPVSGYDAEFCLHPEPLYWATKPKAPKVKPEDIPEPVKPVKRKYQRPPKKGTSDRMLYDERKRFEKNYIEILRRPSPWSKLLATSGWPITPCAMLGQPKDFES